MVGSANEEAKPVEAGVHGGIHGTAEEKTGEFQYQEPSLTMVNEKGIIFVILFLASKNGLK